MMPDFEIANKSKEKLKEPIGTLIPESDLENLSGKTIAIGDEVTLTFINKNLKPSISIVDYKIKRTPIDQKKREKLDSLNYKSVKAKNPAGSISLEAWNALKSNLNEKIKIEIDGEEDLLTLAALFLSENGTNVLYGQPDKGIVLVKVSDELKQKYAELLIADKASEFLNSIQGKTIILHHNDADGCCSAVLVHKYLAEKGVNAKLIVTNDVRIHKNVINEINNEKAKNLIILDLGGDAKKAVKGFSKTMKVLVIDHHQITDPDGYGSALFLNPHMFEVPDEYISPTSYLAYRVTENDDWISAIGVIADKGFTPCKEFLETTKAKYDTDFTKQESLINAADALHESEIAVKELLKSENPEDLLSSELVKFEKKYTDELNKFISEHKEKAEFKDKLVFYEIASENEMRGSVANELQSMYPDKIIIIGEIEEDDFSMSLRTNLDINLVEIIKKSITGLKDAQGGGHAKASGCKVLLKDKKAFLETFIKTLNQA